MREDSAFRRSTSALHLRANQVMNLIRTNDLANPSSLTLGDEHHTAERQVNPDMIFSSAESQIKTTRLWKILKRMPKGSLLHAHLGGMVDLDWLIDTVVGIPGMCMYAPQALVFRSEREVGEFFFKYNAASRNINAEKCLSLWHGEYVSGSLCPVETAATTYPEGGMEGFKKWLKGRCALLPTDAVKSHQGRKSIWPKFGRCFPVIDSMLYYEPVFRQALQRMFANLLEDNVRYAELRIFFHTKFFSAAGDQLDPEYLNIIRVFQEEMFKFKKTCNDEFYGARLIWTVRRRTARQKIIKRMEDCIAAKKAYPEIIAGIDFSGREQTASLGELMPTLDRFSKRCSDEGVNIPFVFHAAEGTGYGDEVDRNLMDAILLGSKRIGHGLTLFKHPVLTELVKEKGILIECCPISNQVLGLTGSVGSHPLPAMFAYGVPIALCNDDPAIFGHKDVGLTADFWHVCAAFENFDLIALASMAENSLRWSLWDDYNHVTLLEKALQDWKDDLDTFCKWLINTHAED